jgi:O-antigen ligase
VTKLIQYLGGFALIFLIYNQVRSVQAFDGLMYVLSLVGWMMIGLGIYAVLFGEFHWGDRLQVLEQCERTTKWVCGVNNPNQFGTVLLLMLVGAIWPAHRATGTRHRVHLTLSIGFLICLLVLVALSGSRGSALSLLITLLAFSFWKSVRPWGIVGGALVACALVGAPFLLDTIGNRFVQQEGGELGGRDVLWEASLLMFRDVLWTGVGIGNGPLKLHGYINSLTSEFNHRHDLPSHNPLLEAGVETGLLGMLVYASIYISALWQFFSRRARTKNEAVAGYFPLLLGVSVGYMASWIKSGGMENHPTVFVLIGLLLVRSQLSRAAEPNFSEEVAAHDSSH